MKKFLVSILILLFCNTLYANVNVNNCDNLKKKSEKLSCLTKLKAKALKRKLNRKSQNYPKKIVKLS